MKRTGIAILAMFAMVVMLTTGFSGIVFGAPSQTPEIKTVPQITQNSQIHAALNEQQRVLFSMFERYAKSRSIDLSALNATAESSLFFQFINQSNSAYVILSHITNLEKEQANLNRSKATDLGPDPQLLANVVTLKFFGITYGHVYDGEGIFRNGYYSGNTWVTTNNAQIEAHGITLQALDGFDEYDILGGAAAIALLLSGAVAGYIAALFEMWFAGVDLYALISGISNMLSTYNDDVDNWGNYLELAFEQTVEYVGVNTNTLYAYDSPSGAWKIVFPPYPAYNPAISDSVNNFLDSHSSNYWYTENVQLVDPIY